MRMLARNPVYKFRHDYSGTNIGTGAWVELIASMPASASAVEIFNGSGSILKLSIGSAGTEDDHEVKYYILPGGSSILLPLEFARAKRISARAIDTVADTGSLVMNFFG